MKPPFICRVRLLFFLILFCVVDAAASAQVPGGALTGTYSGTYRCGQGVTNLKLTLRSTPDGSVLGTFTFYLPAGTQKDAYSYSVQGFFNPTTLKFTLAGVKWETAAPANFGMVGLNGTFDSNELTGAVTGSGCTSFSVERITGAASAETRTVQPAPSRAAAPAPPVATPPSSRPAPASAAPVVPKAPPVKSANAQAVVTPTAPSTTSNGAPVVKWHPDTKAPQTVLKSDPIFVNQNTSVFVEAVCGPNGASVNFRLFDGKGNNGPKFDHHEDPSAVGAKSDIVDIDVSVDGKSHVAKGFLSVDGNNQFVNETGVLFYEPGLAVKTRGERQFEVRLGGSIDNLTQGLARADADAEIEEGLRTSAGPLSDLVKAHTIEMRVPIAGLRSRASFELDPTTPVFREFAGRCYSHFGGSSTPRATPPASNSSPAAPANTAGASRTKR